MCSQFKENACYTNTRKAQEIQSIALRIKIFANYQNAAFINASDNISPF